jgi:hypothetical protein
LECGAADIGTFRSADRCFDLQIVLYKDVLKTEIKMDWNRVEGNWTGSNRERRLIFLADHRCAH